MPAIDARFSIDRGNISFHDKDNEDAGDACKIWFIPTVSGVECASENGPVTVCRYSIPSIEIWLSGTHIEFREMFGREYQTALNFLFSRHGDAIRRAARDTAQAIWYDADFTDARYVLVETATPRPPAADPKLSAFARLRRKLASMKRRVGQYVAGAFA